MAARAALVDRRERNHDGAVGAVLTAADDGRGDDIEQEASRIAIERPLRLARDPRRSATA